VILARALLIAEVLETATKQLVRRPVFLLALLGAIRTTIALLAEHCIILKADDALVCGDHDDE
jgi:hypothetical protein